MLRHEGRLRAFLRRLAGNAADADDLAQDVFLRAWHRAGDFRGTGSYAAWLAGIGWRLFLDRHRRTQRRALLDAAAPEDDRTAPPPSGAGVDLDRAMAALNPAERAAMVLHFGHGWTHEEVAQIVAMPLGSVKSMILRGRAKVQRAMAGAGQDAADQDKVVGP